MKLDKINYKINKLLEKLNIYNLCKKKNMMKLKIIKILI